MKFFLNKIKFCFIVSKVARTSRTTTKYRIYKKEKKRRLSYSCMIWNRNNGRKVQLKMWKWIYYLLTGKNWTSEHYSIVACLEENNFKTNWFEIWHQTLPGFKGLKNQNGPIIVQIFLVKWKNWLNGINIFGTPRRNLMIMITHSRNWQTLKYVRNNKTYQRLSHVICMKVYLAATTNMHKDKSMIKIWLLKWIQRRLEMMNTIFMKIYKLSYQEMNNFHDISKAIVWWLWNSFAYWPMYYWGQTKKQENCDHLIWDEGGEFEHHNG